MKQYVNGQAIELTQEELSAWSEKVQQQKAMECHRPLTEQEAFLLLLKHQLNLLPLDDQTALRMSNYFPNWEELCGQTTEQDGFKFIHNGKLYKTLSPTHTFQPQWVPGPGTESLYQRIDPLHLGNQYDPIPYDGNMALVIGMYYTQDGRLYKCIRSTETAVFNDLQELIDLYLEHVN